LARILLQFLCLPGSARCATY